MIVTGPVSACSLHQEILEGDIPHANTSKCFRKEWMSIRGELPNETPTPRKSGWRAWAIDSKLRRGKNHTGAGSLMGKNNPLSRFRGFMLDAKMSGGLVARSTEDQAKESSQGGRRRRRLRL